MNYELCIVNYSRDVAQLVAHYVRDVGVASSSLVIPTTIKTHRLSKRLQNTFLFSLFFWRKENYFLILQADNYCKQSNGNRQIHILD